MYMYASASVQISSDKRKDREFFQYPRITDDGPVVQSDKSKTEKQWRVW